MVKACPDGWVKGLQMYCSYCGSSNSDDNKYCLNCGRPLEENAVPAQRAAVSASAPAPAPAAAPASAPSAYYAKGCFASAWEDIRGSEGWLKRMLLLGLIMYVPILNFVVTGHALAWAKEIACGKRTPLPKKIFADDSFASGFFVAVMGLLFFVSMIVVFVLFCLIPLVGSFIGAIAILVYGVFGAMVLDVCALRIGISGRFGAGFDFSSVLEACRGNWGSLFCASIVPGFVMLFVGNLVSFAVSVVAMFLIGVNAASVPFLYGTTSYGYAALGAGTAIIYGLCLLVSLYIALTTLSLTVVVTYRAVGHWVGRVVPNWATELGAQPRTQTYTAPAQPAQQATGYFVPVVTPAAAAPAPSPVSAPAPAPEPTPSPAPKLTPAPDSAADSGTEYLGKSDNDSDSSTTVLSDEPEKTLVLIRHDGEEVRVSVFPSTLGKGTAADVQISGNNSISRVHARVIAANGSFAIEDLGSTNKTFINDNPLEEGELVALHCGDELKLGSENLIVRF